MPGVGICITAEITKMLLAAQADVNLGEDKGYSTLRSTAAMCNTEVVKLMLEARANPDVAIEDGRTLLEIACCYQEEGSVEVAKLLLEHGANPKKHEEDYQDFLPDVVELIQEHLAKKM
ncbi:unnamed protein product [Polarella glacialis]|uniref:Uncharacterized protein n=1 Tax=Polarella glacialis TaxID=89957 RepID=A0A813DBY5_POLGL|nr:unnamed protein product [Polarella glacialis]